MQVAHRIQLYTNVKTIKQQKTTKSKLYAENTFVSHLLSWFYYSVLCSDRILMLVLSPFCPSPLNRKFSPVECWKLYTDFLLQRPGFFISRNPDPELPETSLAQPPLNFRTPSSGHPCKMLFTPMATLIECKWFATCLTLSGWCCRRTASGICRIC